MADTTKLKVLQPNPIVERLDPDNPDLDRALKVLSAKLELYEDLWNYYDGDQPLMYTSKRLRDIFDKLDMAKFVENWCSVVVDAANDRINLQGISFDNQTVDKAFQEFWDDNAVNLEASDAQEAALVIGESYVIVWRETEPEDRIDIIYNDPRLVHLFYDPANPKKKWYGAKWFVDSANHLRMNLYYEDRLEYYRSEKEAKSVSSAKHMEPFSPEGQEDRDGNPVYIYENEYGEIPIYHFRLERRKVKGDLENVIPLQNGINKLVTDMMVSAEFGAFPQRWAITDADVGNLKNAPDEIWWIPAGDGATQAAQVGQFNQTDLKVFIDAVDHLATSAAIISRTPKHYLFQQGGDPSGEALIALEAPLNKRCTDHIERFKPTWKEIAAFIAKLMTWEVEPNKISVNFAKPETVQPKTEAEIRKAGKDAGIPLKTLLRDEGKDDAWIEQMEKDAEEEREQNQQSLGVALARSLRSANQPEEDAGPEEEDDQREE